MIRYGTVLDLCFNHTVSDFLKSQNDTVHNGTWFRDDTTQYENTGIFYHTLNMTYLSVGSG
jgi:hypothetical protein